MILENYGSIMSICYPCTDYSLSGSNIQNSMLAFRKDSYVLLYRELQVNINNNYVNIFGDSQQFSNWCIYWS